MGLTSHPSLSRIISVNKASKTFSPMIKIRTKNNAGLYLSTYPPICLSILLRNPFLRPKKVYRLNPGVDCFRLSLRNLLSDPSKRDFLIETQESIQEHANFTPIPDNVCKATKSGNWNPVLFLTKQWQSLCQKYLKFLGDFLNHDDQFQQTGW
jgi:hypothetical protein